MSEKTGKSETLKQMIRLPSSIIGLMDDIIEDGQTYATKPDFIVYSMRLYLSTIIDAYSEIIESDLNPDITDEDLSKMKEVIDDPEMLNHLFTKNKIGIILSMDDEMIGKQTKPIMIYIPIGMIEEIDYIIEKTKIARKLNDFIKQAISFNLSKHYYHEAMLNLSRIEDEKGSREMSRIFQVTRTISFDTMSKNDDQLIRYFLKYRIKKLEDPDKSEK